MSTGFIEYITSLGILTFMSSIWLFVLAIIVVIYVLNALATKKALKAMRYSGELWHAWVPFLSMYALCACIGNEDAQILPGFTLPKGVFDFWWLISSAIASIPYVGSIVALVWLILCGGYMYKKIYAVIDNRPEDEVAVLAYLSAWINLIPILKFLCIKDSAN